MSDDHATRFVLRVAADTTAPASARLFLAASMRVVGLPDDLIEDARLAVSELVTAAVVAPGSGPIEVTFDTAALVVGVGPLDRSQLDADAGLVVDGLFERADVDGAVGFVVPASEDP